MKLYHATTKENAQSLMSVGADSSLVGSYGGLQAGWGFYAAPNMQEAKYWFNKLGGCEIILEIDLPDEISIATIDNDDDGIAPNQYLIDQGLVAPGDNEATINNILQFAGLPSDIDETPCFSWEWLTVSLYFKSRGFDVYISQEDTVVVLNFDLLKGSAFKVVFER